MITYRGIEKNRDIADDQMQKRGNKKFMIIVIEIQKKKKSCLKKIL